MTTGTADFAWSCSYTIECPKCGAVATHDEHTHGRILDVHEYCVACGYDQRSSKQRRP